MPRTAREISHSGIYHIMLRGINKQNIFEETEDYEKMRFLLQLNIALGGIELYGYCLMSNHIHLLLKEDSEPLENEDRGRFPVLTNEDKEPSPVFI